MLTGNLNVALVLAYFALTLVLALSIWLFLGKNSWALLVVSAVCLCPGYVRESCADWDPVPVTMLIGIPVMVFLVCRVANPPARPGHQPLGTGIGDRVLANRMGHCVCARGGLGCLRGPLVADQASSIHDV